MPSSSDLPRKRGRGRPAVIGRQRIVATALTIAREEGADVVSMSSVAERLGVALPALYYHVRNVNELLGLVAVELLRDMTIPDVRVRWDRWLYRFARDLFELVRSEPLFGRVRYLSVYTTPFPPRVIERALRVLTRAGFTAPIALLVFGQLIRSVVDLANADSAREQEARAGRSVLELLRENAELATDEAIPLFRSVIEILADVRDDTNAMSDVLFEWQIGVELAGLRALLEGEATIDYPWGRLLAEGSTPLT